MKRTLLVHAVGTALVQNYEALEAGVNRFVNRKGEEYIDPETGEHGWQRPIMDEPSEVPDRAEYRQAVKDGDLEPADEATARLCGVYYFG